MLNQLLLTEFTLCCRKYNCTNNNIYPSQYLHPYILGSVKLTLNQQKYKSFFYYLVCASKKIPHKHIKTPQVQKYQRHRKFTQTHPCSPRAKIYSISTPSTIPDPHNFFWTMFSLFFLSFFEKANILILNVQA
jgi:hypothetical protein